MTVCLMCSGVKCTANKWWKLAVLVRAACNYYAWRADDEFITDWVAEHFESAQIRDLCGEGCLTQAEQMIRAGQVLPERAMER